jgi:hypothetical protein
MKKVEINYADGQYYMTQCENSKELCKYAEVHAEIDEKVWISYLAFVKEKSYWNDFLRVLKANNK